MSDPLYFVEVVGRNIRGRWFLENDRDSTRADVLQTVRDNGDRVLKVLEVIEDEGIVRDVTEEFCNEARALVLDAAE